MSITMMVHRATNIRLDHVYEENANSVTLEITGDDGEIELTIFDLPRHVTEKLAVLADNFTTHTKRDEAA
jgi:hypothetical protein